jgi:RNA polymerase sigma-70 factor (ECF subfamily)
VCSSDLSCGYLWLAGQGRFGQFDSEDTQPKAHSREAAHVEASLGGDAAPQRWQRVAKLYAELALPTPVVRVNRAVAVGRAGRAEEGLALLEEVSRDAASRSRLEGYQPYHAARADLLRSAGRAAEARSAYDRAIALAEGETERRFLARRRAELSDAPA